MALIVRLLRLSRRNVLGFEGIIMRDLKFDCLPLLARATTLSKYFFDGQTQKSVEDFCDWAGAYFPEKNEYGRPRKIKRYNVHLVKEAVNFVCRFPSALSFSSFNEARIKMETNYED